MLCGFSPKSYKSANADPDEGGARNGKAELRDANALWGKGTHETTDAICQGLLDEIAVIFLLLTHFRKLDSHTEALDHHIEKIDSHVSELERHTERVEASVDKLCALLDIEGKKRSPRRKK